MKNDLKIPMVCELQRNRLGSYKELKVFVNFNSIMIKYSFIVLYIEKREKRKNNILTINTFICHSIIIYHDKIN